MLAIACGGGYSYVSTQEKAVPSYTLGKVEKGNISLHIDATGTIEPINSVDLSANASGILEKVYVKQNEKVTVGQKLATIQSKALNSTREEAQNTLENKEWTIGVENPIKPLDERELITTIQFKNQGLATSGNYRKVWMDSNGRKYVHSINPITGRATQSDVLSATVVAPSTMYADGYATMFMVMGMEKSKAFLAKHPNLAVLLVYSNDKNQELTFKTQPFEKLEKKQ